MTAQVDDSVYVKDMTDTGHLAQHAFDMLRYNRGQNPFLLERDAKKTECSGRDHWHSTRYLIIIAEISIKRNDRNCTSHNDKEITQPIRVKHSMPQWCVWPTRYTQNKFIPLHTPLMRSACCDKARPTS